MSAQRRYVGALAPVRGVRARRLLRLLAEQARDEALSRDQASRHRLARARRGLEVLLRARSGVGINAMSMWEPFSEGARHAVVRAQQVAQMFGSSTIGTDH